jgi:hypothetical protein
MGLLIWHTNPSFKAVRLTSPPWKSRGDSGQRSSMLTPGSMSPARRAAAPFTDEEMAGPRGEERGAVDVVIADEPGRDLAYLSVLIEPDEKLFFDYESVGHEEAAKPLLKRVAEALGYEIELV